MNRDINQETELLICGFVRESQLKLELKSNVSNDVILIMQQFYFQVAVVIS